MAAPKIIIVTWHWPPSVEIGGKVVYRLGSEIARLGADTRVVTIPLPDISRQDAAFGLREPEGIRVVDVPMGTDIVAVLAHARNRIFRGDSMAAARAPLIAAPTEAAPSAGVRKASIGELLNEFPDYARRWIGPTSRRLRQLVAEERPDVVISVSPYFSAHRAVYRSGVVEAGVPWFAWSHDPKSGNPFKAHLPRWRERIVTRWEEQVLRKATRNLVTTDALAEEYQRRFPGLERPYVLPCGFRREELVIPGAQAPDPSLLTITHIGTLYGHRTPVPLLESMARLRDSGAADLSPMRLRIIGDASSLFGESPENAARRLGLENVVSLEPVMPHRDAMRVLAASDVGLLLAERQPLQIPAKTFEYIGMRRPILAIADGATADLVRSNAIGFVASADALDAAVLQMINGWKHDRFASMQPALDAAVRQFDMENLAKGLLDEIRKTVRTVP